MSVTNACLYRRSMPRSFMTPSYPQYLIFCSVRPARGTEESAASKSSGPSDERNKDVHTQNLSSTKTCCIPFSSNKSRDTALDSNIMRLNTKVMMSTPLFVFTLLFLPLMGYFMHQLKAAVDTPPADFGSGSMFDQIAGRYDLINRVLALRMDVGWRQEMTQRVKDQLPRSDGPLRLLDVATGTADVALQLAKEIPSSTILGVDPSNNMLDVGRSKIADRSLSDRIVLETGDARDFSKYEGNSFDGATMAFGIRNVPERDIALCEIHRLLRPSGVLAILEFSEPDDAHGVMGGLTRIFIRYVVPIVGGILSGAPREYLHLQNSIKQFPNPPAFRQLMQTLKCGSEGNGHFDMDDVHHMNFGSVQLYIGKAVKSESQES